MFIQHSKRNWNWFLCNSYARPNYERVTYWRLSCVIPKKSSQTDKLTTTSPVDMHKTCATPCETWLFKDQMQHIKYSEKIFFFSYYSHNYAWWFWLRPHETLCCNKHHKLTWTIFGHGKPCQLEEQCSSKWSTQAHRSIPESFGWSDRQPAPEILKSPVIPFSKSR